MSTIDVKRKQGESAESMLRRFRRRLRQTRKLIRVKHKYFYHRPKSKGLRKEETLRRKRIRERREYLRKIGELKEMPMSSHRR